MKKTTQLKDARLAKGLTQQQVAASANISRAYYSNIEAGRKEPSLKVARRIAIALDSFDIFFEPDVPNRHIDLQPTGS